MMFLIDRRSLIPGATALYVHFHVTKFISLLASTRPLVTSAALRAGYAENTLHTFRSSLHNHPNSGSRLVARASLSASQVELSLMLTLEEELSKNAV